MFVLVGVVKLPSQSLLARDIVRRVLHVSAIRMGAGVSPHMRKIRGEEVVFGYGKYWSFKWKD